MRAQLTAKLGAGWIDNVADVERGAATLEQMRTAWQRRRPAARHLTAVAWIGGAVLDEGEPADSPRGMALAGPRAAMLLHRAADTALAGYPSPLAMRPEFAEAVDAYVAHARRFEPAKAVLSGEPPRPSDVRPPGRRPFITAEMIRRTTFTGTAARHQAACRRTGRCGLHAGCGVHPARAGARDRGLGPRSEGVQLQTRMNHASHRLVGLPHAGRPYMVGRSVLRQLLIVVSVFGVAATLLAMLEGAWLFALAIYGLSIVGLCALLRQAARRIEPG